MQPSLPETLLNIDRSGVVLPLLGFTPFYPTYRSGDRTIDIPNIDPDEDNTVDPDNWKDYVIPVQTLENRLGTNYDFLSNVPTEIQETIENRERDEIIDWINANDLTSPLLADLEISNTDLSTISPNTAVGHDSFVEDSSFTRTGIKIFSTSQIGITEIGIFETNFTENSTSEDSTSEIGTFEVNLPEYSISKVNPFHITVTETTFVHTNSTKIGKAQVNLSEGSPIELFLTEVSFSVNSSSDTSVSHTAKTLPSEILFSPSVESDQFFSIHNSTPKITNVLNNTATSIWSDLLQSQTQLNINFQITDLPTGQLAEATITGFDDSGVPNAETILIDHDANGVDWFVDETPLDNSEFSVVEDKEDKADRENKGEYYLLAAAESEANGKYDLLTYSYSL